MNNNKLICRPYCRFLILQQGSIGFNCGQYVSIGLIFCCLFSGSQRHYVAHGSDTEQSPVSAVVSEVPEQLVCAVEAIQVPNSSVVTVKPAGNDKEKIYVLPLFRYMYTGHIIGIRRCFTELFAIKAYRVNQINIFLRYSISCIGLYLLYKRCFIKIKCTLVLICTTFT